MVTGCDEGMSITKPIITNPSDPTTNGEIKQPDQVEPKPTLAINTVVQAYDGSVVASGTSTNVSEGTKVTVVLGDNAVTAKTAVDKDGAWLVIVSAQKTMQLSPGTVAVTVTTKKVTAKSSFEYTPTEPVEPHENDFVGQVLMPSADGQIKSSRINTRAVSGVTLTVVSGERAGEWSITDKKGNYRFSDPTGAILQLRLRAEKPGYEPKEVIVYRDEPTETLGDGIPGGIVFSLPENAPQKTPGIILIGHEWPDGVRFILEKTLLPHDLLLVRVDKLPKNYSGLYGHQGVVVVENGNCLLYTIAHELAHAHQHVIAIKEKGPNATAYNWENTSEGKAYLKAQKRDWEEVGKVSWSDTGKYLTLSFENMAQLAKHYWNIEGKFDTPALFQHYKSGKRIRQIVSAGRKSGSAKSTIDFSYNRTNDQRNFVGRFFLGTDSGTARTSAWGVASLRCGGVPGDSCFCAVFELCLYNEACEAPPVGKPHIPCV